MTLKAGRSERKDASLLCWSIETRFAARSCACALVDVSTCMPPRPVRQQTGQTAALGSARTAARHVRAARMACAPRTGGVSGTKNTRAARQGPFWPVDLDLRV